MKIGVIIAMDVEYRQMYDALGGDRGQLGTNDIQLWRCGMGKVNAAVGTCRLVDYYHPDIIISTGLAGAIDSSMQVMDVLVASQCVYHDVDCGVGFDCQYGQVQGLPARYDADKELLNKALKVPCSDDERLVSGLICTGDQFITNKDALGKIKDKFIDGLACDMESAAIAQTCYLLRIPFISIRVISDTPGRTDNHQQQWVDFLASMCDRSFKYVKNYLCMI